MNAVAFTSPVLFALMIGFEAADKRIAPVQNCLDECLPWEYRPGIKNYVGFQVLLSEILKAFVLQSFWFCKQKIKSAYLWRVRNCDGIYADQASFCQWLAF